MTADPTATATPDTDWYDRDTRTIAGVEKLRFFPQVAATGHGTYLTTPSGRQVLDLSASWTASGLGHGHPRIVEAVTAAMAAPPGASLLSGTHPHAIRLAEELLDLVPTTGRHRRVYLGHAGTDANDVALRAARHATGRRRIIAFEHGYHGGLGTSMAISGVHIDAGASPEPDLTLVPYPDPYRPWTDPDTLLADTMALVQRHLADGDVAAVIVEPIQSDGGVIVPPAGFLTRLRVLTRQYATLLVVDEVKVGLSRTGHLMAHHIEDVVPDIVTLGKALGGGLPLSAAIGPASALDNPAASALMTTIGNPVSCAAGLAVLDILRDGALAQAAQDRGAQLTEALRHYAASDRPGAAHIGDIRGRGLAIGVEIVEAGTKTPDPVLAAKAVLAGWHLGIIAYPVRGNVIEITPPLTITHDEVTTATHLLTEAIDRAALGHVTDDDIAPYSGW